MPKWSELNVGILQFHDARTTFTNTGGFAWNLADTPNVEQLAPVLGSISLRDDEVWVVDEATSSSNTDRWNPLGARPILVCGGTVAGVDTTQTISGTPTNIAVKGPVHIRDRLEATVTANQLPGVCSGVTLASASTGIYLLCAGYNYDSGVTSKIGWYDATAGAWLVAKQQVQSGMGTIMGTVRKSSGTAMNLVFRVETAATGFAVSKLHFTIVKIAEIDPNELATDNSNPTVSRPAAPA